MLRTSSECLLFHSDQGIHYTSIEFGKHLKSINVTSSFSNLGIPYENSVMKSFIGSIKREALYRYRLFFRGCRNILLPSITINDRILFSWNKNQISLKPIFSANINKILILKQNNYSSKMKRLIRSQLCFGFSQKECSIL